MHQPRGPGQHGDGALEAGRGGGADEEPHVEAEVPAQPHPGHVQHQPVGGPHQANHRRHLVHHEGLYRQVRVFMRQRKVMITFVEENTG